MHYLQIEEVSVLLSVHVKVLSTLFHFFVKQKVKVENNLVTRGNCYRATALKVEMKLFIS